MIVLFYDFLTSIHPFFHFWQLNEYFFIYFQECNKNSHSKTFFFFLPFFWCHALSCSWFLALWINFLCSKEKKSLLKINYVGEIDFILITLFLYHWKADCFCNWSFFISCVNNQFLIFCDNYLYFDANHLSFHNEKYEINDLF